MQAPEQIIILEEYTVLREGLHAILTGHPGQLPVLHTDHLTGNYHEYLNQAPPSLLFSCAGLLKSLPETSAFLSRNPEQHILCLMLQDTTGIFDPALRKLPASGYILKSALPAEWHFAVKAMMEGKPYYSGEIAAVLKARMNSLRQIATPCNPADVALSHREKQVLQLVADGYTNEQIAERIFASKRTVEAHRMRLIGKTGSKNTATLIRFAVENGLVN